MKSGDLSARSLPNVIQIAPYVAGHTWHQAAGGFSIAVANICSALSLFRPIALFLPKGQVLYGQTTNLRANLSIDGFRSSMDMPSALNKVLSLHFSYKSGGELRYNVPLFLGSTYVSQMLRTFLRKNLYTVVHVHGFSTVVWPFLDECLAADVPIIVTLHGLNIWESNPCTKIMGELELQTAYEYNLRGGWITTISSGLREAIISEAGLLHPEKVVVVPNGISLLEWNQLGSQDAARKHFYIKPNKKVLLTVGSLTERKCHTVILEALTLLSPELLGDILYVVVGDGPEMERLKAFTKNHNLLDTVRFMGALRGNELKSVYAAADIFILSSRNEGFGLVALEAYASGLPVILHKNIQSFRELYAEDRTAVAQAHKPEDYSDAIRYAIEKKWDKETIKRSIIDQSWEAVAERYLETYQLVTMTPQRWPDGVRLSDTVMRKLSPIEVRGRLSRRVANE